MKVIVSIIDNLASPSSLDTFSQKPKITRDDQVMGGGVKNAATIIGYKIK